MRKAALFPDEANHIPDAGYREPINDKCQLADGDGYAQAELSPPFICRLQSAAAQQQDSRLTRGGSGVTVLFSDERKLVGGFLKLVYPNVEDAALLFIFYLTKLCERIQ